MSGLTGRRVLVIGASSGIGRAIAEAACGHGASVAAAARRADLLASIDGVVPIPLDVRDADACTAAVARADDALGGIDALVYATGVVPLVPVAAASPEVWSDVLATNLVGAALVTSAALPMLQSSGDPRGVFLSSDSVGDPWPGLVPYAASKAGLEELVRGWRAEHPEVAWTTVVVGPTITGMADGWAADAAAESFRRWERDGYLDRNQAPPQAAEDVAQRVVALLAEASPAPTTTISPKTTDSTRPRPRS